MASGNGRSGTTNLIELDEEADGVKLPDGTVILPITETPGTYKYDEGSVLRYAQNSTALVIPKAFENMFDIEPKDKATIHVNATQRIIAFQFKDKSREAPNKESALNIVGAAADRPVAEGE